VRSAATANLRPFLGIEPAQLLVVQQKPLAPQQVQPAVAEASPDSGDLAQPGSNNAVIRPPAAIADRAAVRADNRARWRSNSVDKTKQEGSKPAKPQIQLLQIQ